MIWATAAVTLVLMLGYVLCALALIREFSPHGDFPTILLIVARTETALYEYQARRFAGHQGVEVILDRRYGERRRQSRRVDVSFIALVVDVAWLVERRCGERRLQYPAPHPCRFALLRRPPGREIDPGLRW